MCAHGARGQSAEDLQQPGARDSAAPQELAGVAAASDQLSVDAALLKTDCAVALEQVKIARERIASQFSNSRRPTAEVLNITTDLLEKLVAWQQMVRRVGQETGDLTRIQRRLAELRVAHARLDVERQRRSYQRLRGENEAGPGVPQGVAPFVRFQLAIDLGNALMKLAKCQLDLLHHRDAEHAETEDLKEAVELLQQRKQQLETQISRMAGTPAQLDFSQLERGRFVEEADRLISEANRLVTRIDRLLGSTVQEPRELADESAQAVEIARSALEATDRLLEDARTQADRGQPHAELERLTIRRLALLREQFQKVRRQLQLGLPGLTWRDAAEASGRVLAAELDTCRSRGERIARRQQHLEQFRRIEAQVNAWSRSVSDNNTVVDQEVEIARLKFEIDLQRELMQDRSDGN
jgi:hypothetical protein